MPYNGFGVGFALGISARSLWLQRHFETLVAKVGKLALGKTKAVIMLFNVFNVLYARMEIAVDFPDVGFRNP